MSLFTCPICGERLEKDAARYYCARRHSYDIASAGYVHLLPANQKNSLAPGDDKNMAAARNRFLNGGWYQPLRDRIARFAAELVPPGGVVFDSGCGEGYYTDGIARRLEQGKPGVQVYGIDISKFSLRWAAKRNRAISFAVASAYHLPLPEKSVDFLLNCFSPLAIDEFRRVLKPGGYFLYVVPAPKHMWELKCVLYDKPYENREQRVDYEGFDCVQVTRVEDQVHFRDRQTILDLFGMTPYFWKTPKEGSARLETLSELEMQISFDLHLFQRKLEL